VVNGVALKDFPPSPVSPGVSYTRFDANEFLVSVANWSDTRTPKRKYKVSGLFAFSNLFNCILVKGLVRVITHIKLEKVFAPIIVAVGNLKILVRGDSHVLVADDIRVLVSIMNNIVTAILHHLAKLENFLGVRASDIFSICNCVRKTQTVKSHF
jgi:hypothetical protein